MNYLSKLAAVTGFILTGKVIEFRFLGSDEMPLDVRGLAFRNGPQPQAVVMVYSGLDDAQTFKTITHELAHVKLDYAVLMDVAKADDLRGYYLSETRTLPKARHNRTYELSKQWIDQAQRLAPGGSCAEKLAALALANLRSKI